MHPVLVHNEYVLGLDVTVNDISLLHVDECGDDLPDDVARLVLAEILTAL